MGEAEERRSPVHSAVSRRKLFRIATLSATAGIAVVGETGGAASAPIGRSSPGRTVSDVSSSSTITIVTNRALSDLDPQSAYDAGSGVPLQGPFESLIRLRPGSTSEYNPLLA